MLGFLSEGTPTMAQLPLTRDHDDDARLARHRVVERASTILRTRAAEGVRIKDVSRLAGISERALRNAFQQEHGLSPKQFDLRQRLLSARRALSFEGASGTVTTIASEFGFFELGRFARIYKQLFGESPSQTMKAHRLRGDEVEASG